MAEFQFFFSKFNPQCSIFAVKIQFLWELAKITFVLISSSCNLIYLDLIPWISYLLMNLCSSNTANVYYTHFPLLLCLWLLSYPQRKLIQHNFWVPIFPTLYRTVPTHFWQFLGQPFQMSILSRGPRLYLNYLLALSLFCSLACL